MIYHDDLLNDKKRVNSFKRAIKEKAHGIVYDLGTGSGILAKFASRQSKKVYALEINPFTIKNIKNISNEYENVQLISADAIHYKFPEKPDTIICEMLDTALIDEEQVPVINNSINYKKENTVYIPQAVTSTIQAVDVNIKHITYYENSKPKYKKLSNEIKYHKVSFLKEINPNFNKLINIPIKTDGLCNAIKITTYTILTDTIICEPTPMLNPPLLIPIESINVCNGDNLYLNLKYIMGGGLNTIKTCVRKNK